MRNHNLIKIIVIIVAVVVILLATFFMFNSKESLAPVEDLANQGPENTDNSGISASASQTSSSSLNKITTSSSVDADMEAYLNSANSVPSPNDFNDSYSDLNQ